MRNSISDRINTKVPSSKRICNLFGKHVPKYFCVGKFASVPMFAQSVFSPSYRVVILTGLALNSLIK